MIERYDDIPQEDREPLERWFNSEPDAKDKYQLLALYNADAFQHWTCPMCGEEMAEGDPDRAGLDWGNFQGVCNPDYSFFGDSEIFTKEFTRDCCNACRATPTRFFPTGNHCGRRA